MDQRLGSERRGFALQCCSAISFVHEKVFGVAEILLHTLQAGWVWHSCAKPYCEKKLKSPIDM